MFFMLIITYQVMEMYILIMFGHKTLDTQFHTSYIVILILLSNMGVFSHHYFLFMYYILVY